MNKQKSIAGAHSESIPSSLQNDDFGWAVSESLSKWWWKVILIATHSKINRERIEVVTGKAGKTDNYSFVGNNYLSCLFDYE